MSQKLYKFLKKEKFPTALCPGCGHGIVMGALLRAIDGLELNMQETVFVSDGGCVGMITDYLLADSVHAPDGSCVALAVGIKKASPNLKVIVLSGDGSMGSKNINHLVHAARKNIEITVLCASNKVYAMAGGYPCATTPMGAITATAPLGNVEQTLDLCKIAYAAGSQFVARASVYHAKQLVRALRLGLTTKGFAFIEALSICPVEYGKRNNFKTPTEMLNSLRLGCVPSDISTAATQKGVTDAIAIGELTRK